VTKVGTEILSITPILTSVPQGAVSSSFLYNLFAADRSNSPYTSVVEFADEKIIYTSQNNLYTAKIHLQNYLNSLSS
jgi:hypothetical protein